MVIKKEKHYLNSDEFRALLSDLQLLDELIGANSVVIKPNFAAGTNADPQCHVMSDLNLLSNLIRNLYSVNPNARIIIAESDSTGHGFAYLKFEHLDLPQSLDLSAEIQKNVSLLDLTRDKLVRVENEGFRHFKDFDHQLYLSETMIRSDFFVSLSNLKMHTVTGYTGACKNLFGCLPDMDKSHMHTHIHDVIHDLVVAIQPKLSIVDAFYGMEENGPVNGIDVDNHYILYGNSPVESDIYGASSAGTMPRTIKYIKLLSKRYGIDINCNSVAVIKQFKKPTRFVRAMNCIGLKIQVFGQMMALLGHRMHACTNIVQVGIAFVRPILLKFFSIEKLRGMKRRIIK